MAAITHVHDVDPHSPSYVAASIRDTFISAHPLEVDKNFGDGAACRCGRVAAGDKVTSENRALFYYDLNRFIPRSAVITAAVWWFYINSTDTTVNHPFHIQRIIRTDWVEMEATWNSYKTGSLWTTAGCGSDGNDYDSAVNASLGTLTTTGWKSVSITSMVTDAWNNRAGVCTFRMFRNDSLTTEAGEVTVFSKERYTIWGLHEAAHLRVTYTLDSKTFQVMIR